MSDQTTPIATVSDQPTDMAVASPEALKPIDPKVIEERLLARIESAKRDRRHRHPEWKRNIEMRLGHNAASIYTAGYDVGEVLRSEINPDWSLTKTKTANLYSQVPTVQGTHENKQYAAAVSPFMRALNYEIGEKRANVGVAMEEVLNDVVNASGVGAAFVGYAARFETVDVPAIDMSQMQPEQAQQMQASGQVPMKQVERVVDYKFFVTRLSPSELLTPSEFVGSCFDDADFVGRSGRSNWSDAKNEFRLTDAQKEQVVSTEVRNAEDDLRSAPDKAENQASEVVLYDELYYWRYRVDPDEKSFKAIWRVVFVKGLDKPPIHEPWKGQQYDQQSRKYVGACKFPIRVLTLTYITDNPIPPSDSAAGRPQVNDMRRSRSQMFKNRERSVPIRWYDVNRIDQTIQASLMRGDWQGMIPTNGDGSRSIGEIARASYPSEDLSFDQQTKSDLMETWQIGPNQAGTMSTGRKTAAETETTQANFATRIGQERGRVAYFFLSICEVLAGWMVLYSDFPNLTPQEKQAMQTAWDQKHVLHDLVLKIRPDSQVALDSQQRSDRLFKFINMTGKSGYVNIKPLIVELAELNDIDPADIIINPQPPAPKEPSLSYGFTGKDDLINPLVMALLVHEKKAPTAEDIKAAQQILLAAQQLPSPAPPAQLPGAPGGPGASEPLPPGSDANPGAPPQQEVHPNWNLAPKVASRSRDMSGG